MMRRKANVYEKVKHGKERGKESLAAHFGAHVNRTRCGGSRGPRMARP